MIWASVMIRLLRDHRFFFRAVAFAALLGAAFATVVDAAAPDASELCVMSFNVRLAKEGHHEAKSENNWGDAKFPRRERAIRIVKENSPDLLGVQEARKEQVEDFEKALPEFEFYGVGRDDGKKDGEFSGIFFRKARFTKDDCGSFWLSATPEK